MEDYGEWNELLKIMKLRHSIELKLTYEKGVKKGAYYQRVLDCKDDK